MAVHKPPTKDDVDYSVYLVTDSTPALLGPDRDLADVVEAAVRGGVGCVQYRHKTADTGHLVAEGRRLHAVTRRYGVPLLINDRVDVALAVGCEGVHVGQDDMDLETARKLLGPDAIIGVTVCNVGEMQRAVVGGADYLGIGTVFATSTKENSKAIIGVDGLQQLLGHLHTSRSRVKTVCIGGINAANASRVMWQSAYRERGLDGVAVVSAIVAAADPEAAARELVDRVLTPPPFARNAVVVQHQKQQGDRDVDSLVMPEVLKAVNARRPLSHNMTNLVVQNLAANVALCVGASPIMANYGEEARDLARLGGALVVNMGTVTPDGLENYLKAIRAYNDAGQPIVLDPVGAGATAVRRSAVKTILGGGYMDVIKGNQSEILACTPEGGDGVQQRGVDSGETDTRKLVAAMRELAALRRAVVVVTGATDYVTAGGAVYAVANGHPYLGAVTGTGCCLGTAVSAAVAAWPQDKLAATVTALVHYEVAAEVAGERADVQGPGTFVPAFLDELWRLRMAVVEAREGDAVPWLTRAKVTVWKG